MKPVMDLRKKYRDEFEKRHKVRLGLMSFFMKASVEALKRFPMVNASIDGSEIIYHNYYDIGIAVGTERGLVVPVLRNAENMSMADIEKQIREYGSRAQEGRLGIHELIGERSQLPMEELMDLSYLRQSLILLKLLFWECIKLRIDLL